MRKAWRLLYAALFMSLLIVPFWPCGEAAASNLVSQTWLPGDTLFPTIGFTTGLPVFGPGYNAALPRVNAQTHPNLTVTMKEVSQQVLPEPYPKTRVWAYETSDTKKGTILGPALWPAVTLEAKRNVATNVTFVNDLPSFNPLEPTGAGLVQGLVTVDRTIHWADPTDAPYMNYCVDEPGGPGCSVPFIGSPPAAVHLHGAETFSGYDGGPEQWFAPNGARGAGFYSLGYPGPGEAVYRYTNLQEAGTLWFHDHALGATRTNVYSGMAAFYFLRQAAAEPKNIPTGAYEIEMALQDRQFDTNAQLFWPDGGGPCGSGDPDDPCLNGPPPNPTIHPFWIPEFIGDVAIVNGAPWPVLHVEPRRYVFRLLDGSNARFYRLTFGNTGAGEQQPPVYAIGADDGYIDTPVAISQAFIAPGEREYVIVDFTGLAGKTVTVMNDAPVPYPNGLVPGVDVNQLNMNKIMQFVVSVPLVGTDKSCNPATGGCKRPTKMVRLTDGAGNIGKDVIINKKRQLILKEWEGPGGPHEVLVNNTAWDGLKSANIAPLFPTDGISELPQQGSTELWEIINLTVDAHPMHTHLVQFQILDRQAFDTTAYPSAWEGAFGQSPVPLPAGCVAGQFCPGYGPPLVYTTLNADGALGGNPAITPYLTGAARAPDPWESGWKDTAKAMPGEVLRLLVRWTPTSTGVKAAKAGRNSYSFKPTDGPGYVWHCHIIDHEDNEMMRPYKVAK